MNPWDRSSDALKDIQERLSKLNPRQRDELVQKIQKDTGKQAVPPDTYDGAASNVASEDGHYSGSSSSSSGSRSMSTSQKKDCSDAALGLLTWLADLDDQERSEFDWNLGRNLSSDRKKEYRKVAGWYDSACLEGPDVKQINLEPGMIAALLVDNARERRPVCSAFHLGKGYLLTARHCLTRRDTQTLPIVPNAVSFLDKPRETSGFGLAPGDDQVRLQRPFYGAENYDLDDYLILGTSSSRGSSRDFIQVKTIDQSRPLTLVGVNSYIYTRLSMENDDRPPEWSKAVRWSKPPTCYAALAQKNGCVFHGCQTAPASSGAGLLQERSANASERFIVGLHLRTVGSGQCAHPKLSWGNIGFRLPDALMQSDSEFRKLVKWGR